MRRREKNRFGEGRRRSRRIATSIATSAFKDGRRRKALALLCNDLFSSSDGDHHPHAIDQYADELTSAALML